MTTASNLLRIDLNDSQLYFGAFYDARMRRRKPSGSRITCRHANRFGRDGVFLDVNAFEKPCLHDDEQVKTPCRYHERSRFTELPRTVEKELSLRRGPWSRRSIAELDARDELPTAALAHLDALGVPSVYQLDQESSFTVAIDTLRVIAAHDLTAAIAHGKTFLGAAPVWVAGSLEQTAAMARRVSAGVPVCLALTERGHGADLLAGEMAAVAGPDGWRLSGEKWLINNASRAGFGSVLARTGDGPRGLTMFLVERSDAWHNLPKVRTHGIRGADISGFTLAGTLGEPIGEVGDGLPVVLKTLQLTRIACTALSLGAGDHALQLAREFALSRVLYGRRLATLPHARRLIGRVAACLLLAEAVSTTASRSVHALPGELSVISPIAKAFVPTIVHEALADVASLLGARAFLTSAPGNGYAKLDRDHRICAIFDGSTAVNRAALAAQFPRLSRSAGRQADGLSTVTDAAMPLQSFDRSRLTLSSRTGCSLVQACQEIAADREALLTQMAGFVPVAALPESAFELAARYERLYAAASCHALARNGDPKWTAAALRGCMAVLETRTDDEAFEALADGVLA
ncbi:acyl-CoA dehydrogenase [Kribbella sp. NPDC051587]|uniref:acyl-CoA dehydrogenase n=1 Tax=Kribbella sp. NPDC051587 TaxID=3364119 RepID=UPI0037BB98AA